MSKIYPHTKITILGITAIMCAALPGGVALQSASAQRTNARRANRERASVDRGTVARAESYTKDRFDYFTETPRGARVVAVNRPRAEALHAIDAGLAELFAVARRNNYRARVNYSDYIVFIARADFKLKQAQIVMHNGDAGFIADALTVLQGALESLARGV